MRIGVVIYRENILLKVVICLENPQIVKEIRTPTAGAMEKNIDTVMDRRFKSYEQSWTTEGVNNHIDKANILEYTSINRFNN